MSSPLALHASHALLIGPALIFIALRPDALPDSAYTALMVLGVFLLGYHAYRAYSKLRVDASAWVNWIHIFLVAPLLILIGYLKKDAASRYFDMLLMLGAAATGYHAVYLIRDMMLA